MMGTAKEYINVALYFGLIAFVFFVEITLAHARP
jgi:hypothetical protein